MQAFIYPPKPRPGDRVAVVSASTGVPAIFPDVYQLGLRRLREELELVPVELPTTRARDATAAEKARDVNAAFADPSITAVLATIGGGDQITVLRHLDAEVLRANPKPFFGYSDNTNLLHHLWTLGIVSYHGGSVMVHLGRPGGLHPLSTDSLRAALFTEGWYELTAPAELSDEPRNWGEGWRPDLPAPDRPAEPWSWAGDTSRVVEAPSWGGNIEIISWLLQAGRVGPNEDYAGAVCYLETSEEMPSATEVYRILRNMGERGLLAGFPAVIWGRPKAWHFDRPGSLAERATYAREQQAAVQRAMSEYNPGALLVFNVDVGHTDPQLIIPNGGQVRVDGPARRIQVRY